MKAIAEAVRIDRLAGHVVVTARHWGADETFTIDVPMALPRSVSGRKLVDRALAAASSDLLEVVPSAFLRYACS